MIHSHFAKHLDKTFCVIKTVQKTNQLISFDRNYIKVSGIFISGLEINDTIRLEANGNIIRTIYYNLLENNEKDEMIEIPFFQDSYGNNFPFFTSYYAPYEPISTNFYTIISKSDRNIKVYIKYINCKPNLQSYYDVPIIETKKAKSLDDICFGYKRKLHKIILVGNNIDNVSVICSNLLVFKTTRNIQKYIEKNIEMNEDNFIINFNNFVADGTIRIECDYDGEIEAYLFIDNAIIIQDGYIILRYTY